MLMGTEIFACNLFIDVCGSQIKLKSVTGMQLFDADKCLVEYLWGVNFDIGVDASNSLADLSAVRLEYII